MKIAYITSNQHKFNEAKLILHDWELLHHPLDLIEIQGEPESIIETKAKSALSLLNLPLIVEDVSFHCSALGGLPGPYIKDFLKKIGFEGLAELVHKYSNHQASAVCHVAYIEPKSPPKIFVGSIHGSVVAPRGTQNVGKYSWNPIFLPNGLDKTFGELTIKEQSEISMRFHALSQLKSYLEQAHQ